MDFTPPIRRVSHPITDVSELTPKPTMAFHPLDPNIRYIWIIAIGIRWTFLFVFAVVVSLSVLAAMEEVKGWIVAALGLLMFLAMINVTWPLLSYRHWGYALRDHDLLIRTGVLWKRIYAVPFARIQHVDTHSGPIERSFNLANLIIHTAGAQLGSLEVPGLPIEEAEALRDYLSEVGHTHANI
ncbi:PH domain-containing protein [Sulfidibacter corallicola]|uniref:PH domain-containing protein n=1 Tax=Sulfidibacter corallicola TaxID=2818388 RepID=A0A8A4TUY7_SULCO|nr:PH domain-containing protein [Sulfidibacter corallicola]QTD53776.1 PH domain-containing protein [Sulfidibacter corallicola]